MLCKLPIDGCSGKRFLESFDGLVNNSLLFECDLADSSGDSLFRGLGMPPFCKLAFTSSGSVIIFRGISLNLAFRDYLRELLNSSWELTSC